MAKEEKLYVRAETTADSDVLKEAEEQLRTVLESVYAIEDAERNESVPVLI